MDEKKVLIVDDDAMMRQVVSAVVAEESEQISTSLLDEWLTRFKQKYANDRNFVYKSQS